MPHASDAPSRNDRPDLTGRSFDLTVTAHFEAAHYLTQPDPEHPYSQLHGHSFRVDVTVSGDVQDGQEWVEDFADLGATVQAAAARLDHRLLNEIEGLSRPTLETLCVWFANVLGEDFKTLSEITLSRPSLNERCTLKLRP